MWFLNSLPEHVDCKIFVEAFGKSYQHTSLQFVVGNSNDKENKTTHFVVIPFPYSANKENGSLKIIQDTRFDKMLELSGVKSVVEIKHLNNEDVTIYKNVKELKKSENSRLHDFPTIREIWDTYVEEEFGVIVAEIQENVVYRLDYTHKISIMSSLFVQTKFSNFHVMKPGCEFNLDLWVSNSRKCFIPIFLETYEYKSEISNIKFQGKLDRYKPNDKCDYCDDVRFSTSCWESSDEEEDNNESNTTPIE